MKKIFTILFLFCFLVVNADDAVTYVLDHANIDTKKVKIVGISGKILKISISSAKTEEDRKLADLVKDIKNIRLISGIEPTNANKKIIAEARKKSDEIMTVKENGQAISMYTIEQNNYISEFIMTIENEKEITVVSITGNLNLEKLLALSAQMEIDGMDHLKNIKKEKTPPTKNKSRP